MNPIKGPACNRGWDEVGWVGHGARESKEGRGRAPVVCRSSPSGTSTCARRRRHTSDDPPRSSCRWSAFGDCWPSGTESSREGEGARARTGRWSGKLTCSPTVEQRKKFKCITNVMYQMYCCSAGCRAKGACFESRGSPVSTSCSNSSLKMVAWNFGRAAQQASASKSDSTCGGDSNARECRLPRGAGSVEGVFARACWRRSPCHAKVVAWDAVLCDKGPGANSTPAMKAVPGGQRGRGEERGRRAGGIQGVPLLRGPF